MCARKYVYKEPHTGKFNTFGSEDLSTIVAVGDVPLNSDITSIR